LSCSINSFRVVDRKRLFTKGNKMSELFRKAVAVTIGLLMLLVGCAGNVRQLNKAITRAAGTPSGEVDLEEYRLQKGDVISVVFYGNPEMDQEVIVKPDGKISLFLVGQVEAEGLTLTELESRVEAEYSTQMKEPEIRLTTERFLGYSVYVGGEVAEPGAYPLTEGLTLLQAIFLAKGFNLSAKANRVIIYRRVAGQPGKHQKIVVDVSTMLKGKAGFQDPKLKPFDTIYVSRSNIVKLDLVVDQYINKIVPYPFVQVLSFILLWERVKD
jgi:protein involved in polysaccharide export with SLBB domain